MEIYVLRLDMYNEWAWENGACSLIGVYDSEEQVLDELRYYLEIELSENEERLTDNGRDINKCIEDIKNNDFNFGTHVNIYTNKENYDNGCESGCYVIEKKILNDSGKIGE